MINNNLSKTGSKRRLTITGDRCSRIDRSLTNAVSAQINSTKIVLFYETASTF